MNRFIEKKCVNQLVCKPISVLNHYMDEALKLSGFYSPDNVNWYSKEEIASALKKKSSIREKKKERWMLK